MAERVPQVSVCMPAYNAAHFLRRAIDSVLSQTFHDFELVICDDASTDETPQVCRGYGDQRVRVERSEERLGQAGNWNRCVELARGTFVILLHADDELLPRFLEQAIDVLRANDDVGLVHCTVQHIDEGGDPLGLQRLFERDTVDRDDAILRRLLLDGCVINPAGVMVRRSAYEAAGAFTNEIVWGVDWHMWIRLALRWPVAYLSEPLARYRQHGQSGTTTVMATGRNARDEMWALKDTFKLIARIRPELCPLEGAAIGGVAHRTWCFAEKSCELGQMAAARAGLRNALKIRPRMAGEARVWGLWLATYLGYDWFAQMHARRQRLRAKFAAGRTR